MILLCVNTDYFDLRANANSTKKDTFPKMSRVGNALYIVYVLVHNQKMSENIYMCLYSKLKYAVITQMSSNTLLQK